MKNIYRNYSEEDLIIAYLSMIENAGKINEEMYEAINHKFNYDEFVKKADMRTALIKEKGRISFSVYKMVEKGDNLQFIFENISSDMLSKKELEDFILTKFYQFSLVKENDKIDKRTIYRSILGIFVSSLIGLLFLRAFVLITHKISFFLLIPLYIINYWVIRQITGKTRDNLVVFIAVLISVIISTIMPFVLNN